MKFEPIKEEEKKESPPDNESELDKAKKAAEIQKYETERIEFQRQAVFAQNDIEDTADLQAKLKAVIDRESQLGKEKYDWDSKKAVEQSEIQKQKAELEKKNAELNKRAQELAVREANLELREKLVGEREELMNSVERQKLEETEKYNSQSEQLKRAFSQVITLLGNNANILIKAGFRSLGTGLWDEIEIMEKWSKNDMASHSSTILDWMREEVEDCNQKAVLMAGNPKQYGGVHNRIVDNLEEVYKLLPMLKPDYLPGDK